MTKRIMSACLTLFLIWGQASFAEDEVYSPPSGPLFHTSINNLTLSINTTIPNKCYNFAGIKSDSELVSFSNTDGRQCEPNENGYCLFKVCDKTTAAFKYSSPAGSKTFKLCLTGKGNTASCQKLKVTTQYAYVADSGHVANGGAVWQCPLNPNGSLGVCSKLIPAESPAGYTPWSGPIKISFADVNGSDYAYIANGNGNSAPNAVYTCSLNNRNDTFNSCTISNSAPFDDASQVAFATFSGTQYAYVADFGSNTNSPNVWQCQISSVDGSLFGCMKQLTGTFSRPGGVTIAKVNDSYYAYISDFGTSAANATVWQCTFNSNGSFTSCSKTPTPSPSWRPWEVTLQKVSGTQYAYVAESGVPSGTGKVWRCTLNHDGSFNTCSKLNPKFNPASPSYIEPFGVAFATINDILYAYVADGGASNPNPQVYQCTVNRNGTFNLCTVTPGIMSWRPDGITILSR